MSCRDFENVLILIAHDKEVEPRARKLALSHSEGCARCAKRLTEARILAAGVRAVRQGIADKGAPARVEAALCNALRQRATIQAGSRIVAAPIRRPRWSRQAMGAAAALILITALLTGAVWYKSQSRDHALNRVAVAASLSQEQPGIGNVKPTRAGSINPLPQKVSEVKRRPQAAGSRAPELVAGRARRSDKLPAESPDAHALSDYIPLTYLPDAMALESGQVIRVKVPLSTFFALGVVPFGAEHADKLVNAELVVGDDGVQRAIRLVK